MGLHRRELYDVPDPPAFVYDELTLRRTASRIASIAEQAGCRLLYSIKACDFAGVLETLAPYVSGFGTSSLFEARLAREVLGTSGEVHTYSPALTVDEARHIADTSDYVSLNSLNQLVRYEPLFSGKARWGLRINPGVSFVADKRYDPCRIDSKLGVPLEQVLEAEREGGLLSRGVTGLHFHTNCDSEDLHQLLDTVRHLDSQLGPLLSKMEWINLGGGYLFDEDVAIDALIEAVDLLKSKYDLEVFFEPGAAMVREAGYIVSSVLDVIDSGDKTIAILDTTVNHMPEVFEYQFWPDVIGDCEEGEFEYTLAGRSCLAGDLFGDYAFVEPLEIGSRVVFCNAGAYTLPKMHTFNGINLPSIYALTEDGGLVLKKEFSYQEFASRSGVGKRVSG